MVFLQGLIIRVIAKTVKHSTYLDTLFSFLSQDIKEQRGDGVIAEIKILQMNTTLRLSDGTKHVVEFFLTRHQKGYLVVVGENNFLGT